eukprot:TRINITY_DN15514_c0_g1_i1.p1 TRINITY_DN15514_c0_g1~~TRINITY_DN15514_c0_g1_i1.p1  ORF type:complete len:276 (-),score=57.33 TRINITY_DN15514_c0_g1_i1:57-848(-)
MCLKSVLLRTRHARRHSATAWMNVMLVLFACICFALFGEPAFATGGKSSCAAYDLWKDQFPLAAARREYFGLSCGKADVQARFAALAEMLNVPEEEALDIFRKDMWVLSEASESLPEKLAVLRSLADSEEEVLKFLRAAPRSIATTTAAEMRKRGLDDMRARSALGEIFEAVSAPVRLAAKMSALACAKEIEDQRSNGASLSNDTLLAEERTRNKGRLEVLKYIFFGSIAGALVWVSYMDATYGGPVHGKGLCLPAGSALTLA